MEDRDQNEHEVDTGADQPEEKKRRTVTVVLAGTRPIAIRQHDAAVHPFSPRLPNGSDVGMTLQPGANHGVDKEWFDKWLDDNKNLSLVANQAITAVDDPEEDDKPAEEESKEEAKNEF